MRKYVFYILELCMMFLFENITRILPSRKKLGMAENFRKEKNSTKKSFSIIYRHYRSKKFSR